MKSSSLPYNRRETRDKRPLSRESERSWCHRHTTSVIKLFWSQPKAPWTSAVAYECAAAQFMDSWGASKKDLYCCGNDTSSYPGPYPMAVCPELHVGCKLGRELLTLPYATADAHGVMGCYKKKALSFIVWRWHQLLSDFLSKGRLSRVSHRLGRELFTLPLYIQKLCGQCFLPMHCI